MIRIEESKFESLFNPIEIGPVEIKNRFAQSPMNLMISQNGFMTEQERAIHAARVKGGFGLSIVGCFMGTRMAARFPAHVNLNIFHPKYLPPLVELTDTVHYFGGKVFAQVSPGFGRQGTSWEDEKPPSAYPKAIKEEKAQAEVPAFKNIPAFQSWLEHFTKSPRKMTVEEIKREEKEFVRSVWLAMCAGFDGVEIHGPHGYLIQQFLSPLINEREDEYGGCLENRMRFLLELVRMTKGMAGDFPIGVRLSAEEHIPGGITVEDTKTVVKELEKVGIDYIHFSDGAGMGDPKPAFGGEEMSKHLLEHAAEFKEILEIPVMIPSQNDPEVAEKAIREGKLDIVALGRQSLADPDFPTKVKEGRLEEINKCKRCNICCNKQYSLKGGLCCVVNPELGNEKYMSKYQRGPRPKEVPVLTWGQRHLPPEPPFPANSDWNKK